LRGKVEMRLHSNSWAVSLLVASSLWALLLGSCSDDTPNAATTTGGSGTGASGATAGTNAGGTSAGTSSAGASGNVNAGSSAGGVAGSAGSSAGTGGGGQTSGGGGSGGSSGGGNGGSGGAPRVYTIEGCDEPGAGGAGSAGESNAGGDANTGGNPGAPVGGAGEGGAGSIIPAISASFTVYDFVTDKPVQTCVDRVNDFEIAITGDAPLTLAANLAPGLMPGSVVWTYDGMALMPHNIFPYTLGPDDNGDFQEPAPALSVGEHVLSITVYADADAMGGVLGQASITITIVEG
jgi:hypothetical protein